MVTSGEAKTNLTRGDAWLRVFFIIVFGFVFWVIGWVLAAVVLLQVCWSLITANTSQRLRTFGASLGEFLRQIVRFITYNSDEMPFPFADWPDPGEPESSRPEPDRPIPEAPQPSKPKAAKSRAARPKPAKPKPAEPEPAEPEPEPDQEK